MRTAKQIIHDAMYSPIGEPYDADADSVLDALKDEGFFVVREDVHDENAWLHECIARAGWDWPEWDATDYAHPAWWRGHEHSFEQFCRIIQEALDGKVHTGAYSEPLESIVKRIEEGHMEQMEVAKAYAAAERELAVARVLMLEAKEALEVTQTQAAVRKAALADARQRFRDAEAALMTATQAVLEL